ncbi:AAA family ATPase [Sulfurimonas sp.]|uniref:AAA family ATPase n=1 Tax=Sulfurimonas sp. TaxID=2022749 RepID=UPI002608BDF7|nr:AAA family ATPase [Sulfurimonas sp.]
MELIYLWVEEYKNITKQGFNFSPRFECSYDEATQELTIDEKKDYVNIFPENINITAIVGENGSGKSSILKVLKKILDYIPYTELGYGSSGKQEYPFSFIIVVKTGDKIQYISSFSIHTNIDKANILGHYNYYLYLADDQKPISEEYRTDKLTHHRFSLDNSVIAQMLTSQYVANIDFKLTTFMYLPTKIEIKPIKLHELFSELTGDYEQGFGVSDIDLSLDMSDKEFESARKNIRNQSFAKADDLNEIFINTQDNFHKYLIIWYIKEYGDDDYYQFEDKDFLSKEYTAQVNSINEKEFNEYFKEKEKEINTLTKREKEIYFNYCKDFFEFDFIDLENRKFNHLSHGEQTIFSQFLNIYYFSLYDKEKIFLFLMDEPDLSLHPQWQKKYLFELYNLLNRINFTFNIILTTHSPFILSDLPKENIKFLKGGKQTEVNIDTFGANIHTLLSHGFFMQDGLIGEFAKKKMNEVIKILKRKRVSQKNLDYCKKIISIIGEPILKSTLEKMLDDKLHTDESELKKLEREQKEIQEKIHKLKDNQ